MGSNTGRAPFFYGWIVVWAAFLILLVANGVRLSLTTLIKPWEAEFGWTRDTVSVVGSISLLVYGAGPLLAGRLADRRGARIVVIAGIFFAGAGAILTSFIGAFWQLALSFGVLIGLGGAFASPVTGASLAARWFLQRRGLAVSVVSAGMAGAQVAMVPLMIFLVGTAGWRSALLWVGLAYLVVLIPVLSLLVRSNPQDMGLRPYGASDDAATAARQARDDDRSTGLLEAMRTRPYWFLALGYFVCGFSSLGFISTHLVPYTVGDLHLTEANAAQAFAVLGVFDIAGTIFVGFVSDRFGRAIPLGVTYLLRLVSYVVLMNAQNPVMLLVWGVLYGVTEMATIPLVAGLSGGIFGRRSLGTIYGSIFLSHQIGAAVGASYGGLMFRLFGMYQPALVTTVLLLLAAGVMSFAVGERRVPAPKPVAA